ncbi:MAG: preprotein translocase subunit SecG [candidate division Zixibacteria bacterium]|nr:preprotein translocase subunit SecG [candidate division Zixibacteria bacterium]
MFALLISIHILVCISLIITVLLQSAKGEGLAGAFGGGGISGAVFGGRGAATFLSKATTYLAVAFMLSCLALTFVSPGSRVGRQESAVRKELGNVPAGDIPLQQPAGAPPVEQPGAEQIPTGGETGTNQPSGGE